MLTIGGIHMLIYPLVFFHVAIEHGPFIVDFPIKNGGSFHSYHELLVMLLHRTMERVIKGYVMLVMYNYHKLLFL